ncbi:hypothetical protein LELG_02060 [Lodderomyces elongisporus NRRL YB-4239]|uniref:Mediator of RNA polymerase II transcription subunit 7 n=1 Tax=Lodderomyces elongisporus (strain ATCC 11503 / CBS 2605 / JCM 1781 / NBRC 1676 / NRRL YB-4239) TaxID=379508 RepID=A5DXH3_LODEL|nr:hypothetical protein LELG_02060 [Lodderomyces elongisporus NRRL YB-4239]
MSNDEDLISSLYPPPPPFVKFFTPENLTKLQAWKDQQEQEKQPEPQESLASQGEENDSALPPGELQFLIPPSKPSGSQYRGYGNIWSFEDAFPSLKDTQWPQLYDSLNLDSRGKIAELHKIMDSLLLNFLELVGVLSVDPLQFENKVKDMSALLINFNHLLNTYRPHQSRESLIMMLKNKINDKNLEIQEIDRVCEDVKRKIRALVQDAQELVSIDPGVEEEDEQDDNVEINKNDIKENT